MFDAVAALLGVRDAVNYEGQAAIELEQLADPGERGSYPARVTAVPGVPATALPDGTREAMGSLTPLHVRGADVVRAAADDLAAGVETPVIAGRFHNAVDAATVTVCEKLRAQTGLGVVALSGGVFQNVLLTGGS